MKWNKCILLCAVLLSVVLTGCAAETTMSQSTENSAPAGSAAEPVKTEQTDVTETDTFIPQGEKYIALTFDDGPTGNEGG